MPDLHEEYLKQKKSSNTNDKKFLGIDIIARVITYLPGLFMLGLLFYWQFILNIHDQEILQLKWKYFRDLLYILYVVTFLIVSFILLLFKEKFKNLLSRLLPAVIASLLLVTFSYAIAGLVVDIYYLVGLLINK